MSTTQTTQTPQTTQTTKNLTTFMKQQEIKGETKAVEIMNGNITEKSITEMQHHKQLINFNNCYISHTSCYRCYHMCLSTIHDNTALSFWNNLHTICQF